MGREKKEIEIFLLQKTFLSETHSIFMQKNLLAFNKLKLFAKKFD